MRSVWHQAFRVGVGAIALAPLATPFGKGSAGELITMARPFETWASDTQTADIPSDFAGLWRLTAGSVPACRLALSKRRQGNKLIVDLEGCAGQSLLNTVHFWRVSHDGVDLLTSDGSIVFALSSHGPDRLQSDDGIMLERAPE